MSWETIHKTEQPVLAPLLADYEAVRATFSWAAERAALDGLPDGGLNIAHEAVDRHLRNGRGDRVALRFLGGDGVDEELTYAELADRTARFADVLRAGSGCAEGDRVFGLLGRRPGAVRRAARHAQGAARSSPRCSARSGRSRSGSGWPWAAAGCW